MGAQLKKWILAVFVLLLLLVAGIFIFHKKNVTEEVSPALSTGAEVKKTTSSGPIIKIIGSSIQNRKIESYTYGSGSKHLAFVGGMHGGYEWNTVFLAYKFIDYLNANPSAVPAYLTVSVVPDANPDGMYKVVGHEGRFALTEVSKDKKLKESARFNGNGVDLNRNFDCEWKSESTWKGNVVSAGASVFSESEAKAIRDFMQTFKPVSAVFWHSQSGNVYASDCESGILPETLNVMNTYAKAAGYGAVPKFDAYKVTGDSEGWLAKIGIPAITVELKTHDTVEWEQNLAGIKALFTYYSPKI